MDKNRKIWNERQQTLRKLFSSPEDHRQAMDLFLSQHAQVHSAEMSDSAFYSFEDEVWKGITETHIRLIPENSEHSIAWIIWHISRIEDVTMSLLLRGEPQLLNQGRWFDCLGVPYRDTGNFMTRADVDILSQKIDIGQLRSYRREVGRITRKYVTSLPVEQLKQRVEPTRLASVVTEEAVDDTARSILDYWGGLTLAGLLLMPPTRHNFIHINEAIRLKKKVAGKK